MEIQRRRILGLYAHPDDETFCTGGTFAKYAALGCEVMVVSATRGQAGQIRSASIATRRTLPRVREEELRLACERLGIEHVECWGYPDGALREADRPQLEAQIARVIRSFRPDVVFTFGDDGAYGHPDHVAISQATTTVCAQAGDPAYFPDQCAEGLEPFQPPRVFHAAFPERRILLLDRLVRWLMDEGPQFKGDPEFVHALLLLAEEASTLHCVEDHFQIKWFPAGFSIIEQGETASALFLLLSGGAEVVRETNDGTVRSIALLEPGQFFGEQGIARGMPRNASVVATESATCLVFSPARPSLFEGRGAGARLVGLGANEAANVGMVEATTRIDVADYIHAKLDALAAYQSQFPLRPNMLPEAIFRDLFGEEFFLRVLPPRELEADLGAEFGA